MNSTARLPPHATEFPAQASRGRVRRGHAVARLLAGAWREAVDSLEPALDLTEAELDDITPLLCQTGAGALAWRRIRNTPLADTDAGRELHEVYRRFRLSALLHQREIAQVLGLFRAEGIEAVLVKGWAIARRYPDPALRPYGDIDLCVRPDQFSRAEQALERIASIEGPFVDLHRGFTRIGQTKTVQSPRSNVQRLSALRRLWTLDLGPWTKDGDDWDELYARSQIVTLDESTIQRNTKSEPGADRGPRPGSPGGVVVATGFVKSKVQPPMSKVPSANQTLDIGHWTLDLSCDPVATTPGSDCVDPLEVRILSDEDHLRLLCLHLLRSGARRPAWLCDVALLVEQITSPKSKVQSPYEASEVQSSKYKVQSTVFDWQVCLGRNPMHAEWVGVAVRLAHELLGVDISATPFAQKQLPRWLVPAVLAQWGKGSGQGAVGSRRNHRRLVRTGSSSDRVSREQDAIPKVQSHDRPHRHWTLDIGLWTDLYRRWDNPVRATAAVGGRFDERSRWPYRLAELLARTPEVPEQLQTLWSKVRGQRSAVRA